MHKEGVFSVPTKNSQPASEELFISRPAVIVVYCLLPCGRCASRNKVGFWIEGTIKICMIHHLRQASLCRAYRSHFCLFSTHWANQWFILQHVLQFIKSICLASATYSFWKQSCHSFISVANHGYRVQCSLPFSPKTEQKRWIHNFTVKKWTRFWSELFLNIWSGSFKCFRGEKSWISTKQNLHLEWKAAKADNREVWSQMETRDYY